MKTTLPAILEQKLGAFRRRVWTIKLAEGIFAALFGLAVSFLIVFALDRFWETPGWVRLLLLIAGAAGLCVGLPLKWYFWVWRQRGLEDVARLLRRTRPRLGDQLLGIVELARRDDGVAGRSERLVQAAMAQAAEAVKDQDFRRSVPDPRHRRWGWIAGIALVVTVTVFAVAGAAARNAAARWIAPMGNAERFTFARVVPLPVRMVVPYAEPFELRVRLSPETRWSPSEARGRFERQPAVRSKLANGVYTLAFPPQKQDAPLAVRLGDVRKTVLVQPRVRPELSAMAVRLRLPDYLRYQSEPVTEVRGGAVSVLKGARAAFEAKASRDLAEAELDGKPQKVAAEKIVTDFEPVDADMQRKFTWKDQDGLTPREPLVLKVKAVEDAAPSVVARRETLEEVVLDSEVVTFDVSATDDFGVKKAGLMWRCSLLKEDGVTPISGEKLSAAGEPEKKELAVRATFCAVRDGVAPQTLEIRAWADDYLPGRPHAHSAAFVLHVLNKTDHALWLTAQFGKWLEAAKESYEREQQLHETNKELRALSPADLDRPENRRRVAQQAAAENANASRLEGLTQSGKSLVEQATKNDEFDAKRLESWATMLKVLKDISANRMPSVSDLLKQTAGAPTGKAGAAAQAPGKQGSPQPSKQGEGASPKNVSQGNTQPGAMPSPGAIAPGASPKPQMPSLSDREAGLGNTNSGAPKPAAANSSPKPPGGGKLGLPSTTLGAAPGKKSGEAEKPPESPAQEKMESAIQEQKDLLTEFAKVSDQLSEILASLEASTFVKRLKAASRQQMRLATAINQKTLDAFGIERQPTEAAAPIVKDAKAQSEEVRVIQSDMEAYFQRKQDSRFKKILDEMKKATIVQALAADGEKLASNLSGQSMNGSEYWADTLDRWAEELVAASNCKSCSSCSGDSLPPEIVLKVMQALRDEMKLRDETREAEAAKPAADARDYLANASRLGEKQAAIGEHTQSAMTDILALPEGERKFGKELRLLQAVTGVMDEARDILVTPDTGGKAIAAETEAIELLLQAKRQGSNGGGGGGSNPGGGGRAETASSAALADLGPGGAADAVWSARPVGQATGRAGKEFPEEFKTGLDTYFDLLEGQPARK